MHSFCTAALHTAPSGAAVGCLPKAAFRRFFCSSSSLTPPPLSEGGAEAVPAAQLHVPVSPRCVSIVHGPEGLYSAVEGCIQLARRRLLLSALYIGTGSKERRLLRRLQDAKEQHPQLQVRLLVDFLRSTRSGSSGGDGPAALLLPLVSKRQQQSDGGSSSEVFLFCNPLTCSSNSRNPVLQGLHKLLCTLLPHRHREALGTQHMKCVVSDDLVLLTGANFSEDYFVNRTDRCILIRSRSLADAVDRVLAAAQAHAFKLLPHAHRQLPTDSSRSNAPEDVRRHNNTLHIGNVTCCWPATNPSEMPQANPTTFRQSLASSLRAAMANSNQRSRECTYTSSNPSSACLVSLAVQAGFTFPPIQGQEMLLDRVCSIAANSIAAAAAAGSASSGGMRDSLHGEHVTAPTGLRVILASPYLNFTAAFLQRLKQLLKQMRHASLAGAAAPGSSRSSDSDTNNVQPRLMLLTASPQANSFYKSQGLSFWIPPAYAVAAHATARALAVSATAAAPARTSTDRPPMQPTLLNGPLMLLEYARPAWTFHAKGIWIVGDTFTTHSSNANGSSGERTSSCCAAAPPSPAINATRVLLRESLAGRLKGPISSGNSSGGSTTCTAKEWAAVSLIGSTNLSARSSCRDLELLALLRTTDRRLQLEQQQELGKELLPFCLPLSEETLKRRFPSWLSFAVTRLGLGSFL
ncbi:probable CDP-diacylglycerol--glycerol-3-phosphate 3-phosphatidyltransferase [Cyclospora cayetanensis]|uniref:CDP-diacylglycerol--glycerol-3-phosphate 3-phosphatidyltransferase n=1 Tax=Cyclospora cayetanensis TaxID=88456 RepID=A0A6P6RTV4_9EIME|nr:probable CDP-diacylglycerol--glycerol-3-phosphate 3-phosphatidyltransferase [Cyclospora cayetanensis]